MKVNKQTDEQSDFKKGHKRTSEKLNVVRIVFIITEERITELEDRIGKVHKNVSQRAKNMDNMKEVKLSQR